MSQVEAHTKFSCGKDSDGSAKRRESFTTPAAILSLKVLMAQEDGRNFGLPDEATPSSGVALVPPWDETPCKKTLRIRIPPFKYGCRLKKRGCK